MGLVDELAAVEGLLGDAEDAHHAEARFSDALLAKLSDELRTRYGIAP